MSDDRRRLDPYAPPPPFPEARWARAGATRDQLDGLRSAWYRLSSTERAEEARRVAGVSDDDLRAQLHEHDDDTGTVGVLAGTVDEVTFYAEQHPDAAPRLLEAEQAGKARKTLLEELRRLAGRG